MTWGALRMQLKQQGRTGGHRVPELSCSGRLLSVSGTIKMFKRPVQITCCNTAWLLSHATTTCHAEKYAQTHTNTQALHADRMVPRGAKCPVGQWLTIPFTLTGVKHIKMLFCVAWGHVTEGPYINLYSCLLCLKRTKTDTQIDQSGQQIMGIKEKLTCTFNGAGSSKTLLSLV